MVLSDLTTLATVLKHVGRPNVTERAGHNSPHTGREAAKTMVSCSSVVECTIGGGKPLTLSSSKKELLLGSSFHFSHV